jgi:hypothetical protein
MAKDDGKKDDKDVLVLAFNEAARAKIGEGCPARAELRLDKFPLPRALLLKKATKLTPMALAEGLADLDPEAVAAAAWLALYLAGVRIKYDDLLTNEDLDLFDLIADDDEAEEGEEEGENPTVTSAAEPKKKTVK